MAKDRWHSPMPRVPRPARPNDQNQRYAGGEPVDYHARIWAQYKDIPEKPADAPAPPGCVFCKPSTLPDGVYDYGNSNGFIPTDLIQAYGQSALLGGHELDAEGALPLRVIGGDPLPAMLGTLRLTGVSVTTGVPALGAAASLIAANLVGVLALLWPSSLGDSSLYSDDELRTLEQARTRVRLHIEVQPDGTLKGYGFNTQARRDWEMVPVVQFQQRGEQQVADFGDGVTLIWTPAVDTSRASAIPPLQEAPKTPAIWIFPPTEQADRIIVNPIYPPEYRDFILVFPADSGCGRYTLCWPVRAEIIIVHRSCLQHFQMPQDQYPKRLLKGAERGGNAGKTKRVEFMSGITNTELLKSTISRGGIWANLIRQRGNERNRQSLAG